MDGKKKIYILLALIIVFAVGIKISELVKYFSPREDKGAVVADQKILENLTPTQKQLEADEKKAIQSQGQQMGNALIGEDYETYLKFTYPKVIEGLGGPAKMVEILKASRTEDNKITQITVGEAVQIVSAGAEIQAIVPQTYIVEVKKDDKKGSLLVFLNLIAISRDIGKTWTFLDTGDKDLKTLQNMMPNLSDELSIPRHIDPVFTPK
jgi:hypothetical protein